MKLHHWCINTALNLLWGIGGWRVNPGDLPTVVAPLVRRFPFWATGHRLLAEEALQRGQIAQAYASAHCLAALATEKPTLAGDASYIFGRCFLRRGDWRSAQEHLSRARTLRPAHYGIHEEEAAALLLGGLYQEALEILQGIPHQQLSAQAKAAIAFARSKISPA